MSMPSWVDHPDRFERRHNGLTDADQAEMLKVCKLSTMDELMAAVVPAQIRGRPRTNVGKDLTETEALEKLYNMVKKNEIFKSYIGMGYHNTITPPAILRNIIQNPGWYTPYTPYQAEISQGRMESLVTYQTMIADLTAMPIAQASLLVCVMFPFNACLFG
jgi:glycine dehydrogenase